MKKKTVLKLLFVALVIVINVLILSKATVEKPDIINVSIEIEADKNVEFQFFYSYGIFDVEHCQTVEYSTPGEKGIVSFSVPEEFTKWRVDFGREKASIKVFSISIDNYGKYDIKDQLLNDNNELKNIASIQNMQEYILVETEEEDPQCIFFFDERYIGDILEEKTEKRSDIYNIIYCIIIDILATLILFKSHVIMELLRDIKSSRTLMFSLAKNDFKTKYVGSYLGIVWAFVQPVITILVYWFVFGIGLKSGDVGDIPFVLWLVAGLVPWFFFSDALSAGTSTMMEYQYLVKKVVFKISILPIVKVISALFVHLFFMAITIVLYWLHGYTPDLYTLQIVYYSICTFALVLALVYFTCAVVVFFKDTSQLVMVFLQVGIWMTPIMWQVSILPQKFLWIFEAMPMYYIVSGYRDSLIYKNWFWEKPYEMIYFWVVTIVLLGIGTTVFKKLKVHFADVL